MKRARHSNRGFTLVEVLVALVIVAVALSGSLLALSAMIRNEAELESRAHASWLASNLANELILTPALLNDTRWPLIHQMLGGTYLLNTSVNTGPDASVLEITVAAAGQPAVIIASRRLPVPEGVQ